MENGDPSSRRDRDNIILWRIAAVEEACKAISAKTDQQERDLLKTTREFDRELDNFEQHISEVFPTKAETARDRAEVERDFVTRKEYNARHRETLSLTPQYIMIVVTVGNVLIAHFVH